MKTNYSILGGSLFCAGLMLLPATTAQAFRGDGGGRFGGSAGGWGGARPDGMVDRSGTYNSLHHGSGTYNQQTTRTSPGNATGTTSWTNANGGTGTHTFNNTYSSTGTGTGTGTHESSTTYANGKTSSSQGTYTKTAPGDGSYTGTHTGANGNVTEVNKTSTTSDGVRTVDSTYTNTTTGKTSTVDKSFSTNANGSKQVDSTATGANGKSVSSIRPTPRRPTAMTRREPSRVRRATRPLTIAT